MITYCYNNTNIQIKKSPRLGQRTVFRDSGLCRCVVLFETNNFILGAVLLLCLISELQEPFSPEVELRTYFPEFWPSYVLFLVFRNKHAKFCANRYIRSRATTEHACLHTYKLQNSILYIRFWSV
jgi:hypothetical protein